MIETWMEPTRYLPWYCFLLKVYRFTTGVGGLIYRPICSRQPSMRFFQTDYLLFLSRSTAWLIDIPDGYKLFTTKLYSKCIAERQPHPPRSLILSFASRSQDVQLSHQALYIEKIFHKSIVCRRECRFNRISQYHSDRIPQGPKSIYS